MKHLNKLIPFVVVGMIAFGCGSKPADSNEVAEEANEEKFDDRKDEKDADFVAEAVAANYAEIAMSTLAAERSDNAQVKEVAQMLVTDHNKLLGELQSFATAKAITIPVEAEDEGKRKLESLIKEDDMKDFNKEWCNKMVDKHQNAISNYESRRDKTEDAELKAWIEQTLPHLRTHLDKLKACEEGIKALNKN